MKKLVVLTLFCLIAAVAAQWNNQNGQFPNFPPIDCNAPGAICGMTERVCDGFGNCRETSSMNGSALTSPTKVIIALSCGVIIAIKMYL